MFSGSYNLNAVIDVRRRWSGCTRFTLLMENLRPTTTVLLCAGLSSCTPGKFASGIEGVCNQSHFGFTKMDRGFTVGA